MLNGANIDEARIADVTDFLNMDVLIRGLSTTSRCNVFNLRVAWMRA